MKVFSVAFCVVFGIGGSARALASTNYAAPFSWEDTKYFLAFGDSYTYVQGTYGLQNYSFIGDLQNFSYTPAQILSNEIIQNQIGTSAGGPNWPLNLIRPDGPRPNATMLNSYNNILNTTALNFAATHPGTKAMVFDTFSFLSSVLDDPAPYGITNTTNYCPNYDAPDIDTNYAAYGCQPIPEYFWYNTGHITYHTHEILAKEVRKFLNSQSG
ncbi:hypothetical protein DID88_003200 [Monilinia fructigena]|uniref:Carbohydrate esterase family 16 protein n=1 Tax=Monilinia fructigena TaxID=38457 RepID=A0A395IUS2_9HELO|nr:hypothetical protein DID88_003200 [Monilinia fructigena]